MINKIIFLFVLLIYYYEPSYARRKKTKEQNSEEVRQIREHMRLLDSMMQPQFRDTVVCFGGFGGREYDLKSNWLINATFFRYADFSTPFLDTLDNDFWESEFRERVTFEGATLNCVSFRRAKFDDVVIMDFVKFLGPTDFRLATFKKTLNINHSVISELSFSDVVFPDTVNFSYNSNINSEIDFTIADLSTRGPTNKIKINLYKSDVSKLRLDYLHFELFFPDSTDPSYRHDEPIEILTMMGGYDHTKPKVQVSAEEKGAVYEALLNNFEKNGQLQSYKLLDIEYQTFKWKDSWASAFIWLPLYWWNFGYNREYIFYWIAALLLTFTIVSYFFIHYLNTKVYIIPKIPVNDAWMKKLSLRDFRNRLWSSFTYTTSVFFSLDLESRGNTL